MQVFTERKDSTDLESQSGAKPAAIAIAKDSTHLERPSGAKQAASTIATAKLQKPPADLGILKEQVLDDNLLRLWRTGSHYEQYMPEEDGDVDVSYCMLYTDM